MHITASELSRYLEKYLKLAGKEEIFITYQGRTIAKLCSPYQDRIDAVNFLYGILPSDGTLEEARDEALSQIRERRWM